MAFAFPGAYWQSPPLLAGAVDEGRRPRSCAKGKLDRSQAEAQQCKHERKVMDEVTAQPAVQPATQHAALPSAKTTALPPKRKSTTNAESSQAGGQASALRSRGKRQRFKTDGDEEQEPGTPVARFISGDEVDHYPEGRLSWERAHGGSRLLLSGAAEGEGTAAATLDEPAPAGSPPAQPVAAAAAAAASDGGQRCEPQQLLRFAEGVAATVVDDGRSEEEERAYSPASTVVEDDPTEVGAEPPSAAVAPPAARSSAVPILSGQPPSVGHPEFTRAASASCALRLLLGSGAPQFAFVASSWPPPPLPAPAPTPPLPPPPHAEMKTVHTTGTATALVPSAAPADEGAPRCTASVATGAAAARARAPSRAPSRRDRRGGGRLSAAPASLSVPSTCASAVAGAGEENEQADDEKADDENEKADEVTTDESKADETTADEATADEEPPLHSLMWEEIDYASEEEVEEGAEQPAWLPLRAVPQKPVGGADLDLFDDTSLKQDESWDE